MWQEPESGKSKQKQLSIVFAEGVRTQRSCYATKDRKLKTKYADVAGTRKRKKQAKTIEYCFCRGGQNAAELLRHKG